MLEAEATADMLLMTQPFTAPTVTEQRPEEVLVRAVLNGERDRFARLYEMYAPMVHGILLARVPRGEVDDLVQEMFTRLAGNAEICSMASHTANPASMPISPPRAKGVAGRSTRLKARAVP